MSSSINQFVKYPSIKHLASIAEKETKSMGLNPPAERPLTQEDQEELNFSDVCTFIYHVESAPREVYDLVMRFWKHLVLVDKQNQKLKLKFTNYEKANKVYVINNAQLKVENDNLENWLANLEKQLENAWSDKYSALSPPLPPLVIFDDSDDNSKQSKKTKSTKLLDLPIFTDGHTIKFDINVWESKMVKKLNVNANHYPTKALCMAYINSCMDGEAYKHLAVRSRIGAQKPFATTKEMFEVLQKAYSNVNQAHTAMNKFWDLKMMKDFNSFWAELQILASKLDHNKAILISELKFKLIPLLSQAMAGGVSWPTDIHEYAKQCQQTYQDLKNIEIQMPIANFAGNQYNQETNENMSTNTNANAKTVNCSKRSTNSSYSWPPSVASNFVMATYPAHSEITRLTWEKTAKLQRENCCFTCKKVGNHRPKCSNEWQPILVLTNMDSALTRVNISEMAVPQPGHVEVENK